MAAKAILASCQQLLKLLIDRNKSYDEVLVAGSKRGCG
jgi:hypothetical protein